MKIETKIEYMTRRLKQFRKMKPEVTLPIQRDFPNCDKYTKCCHDDKEHWEKVEIQQNDGNMTEKKVMKGMKMLNFEVILHNVSGFKVNKSRDQVYDTPEGFEGW